MCYATLHHITIYHATLHCITIYCLNGSQTFRHGLSSLIFLLAFYCMVKMHKGHMMMHTIVSGKINSQNRNIAGFISKYMIMYLSRTMQVSFCFCMAFKHVKHVYIDWAMHVHQIVADIELIFS